jgi:tetratricopeptide (TPR) repeat protein
VQLREKIIKSLFAFAMGLAGSQYLLAEVSDFSCGSLNNPYGPYDYRSDKDKLDIVEGAHLTPEVLNLTRGKTSAIGGDIDYTLRAFPNHHLALMAMVRLGEKQRLIKPVGARYSVECYLYRANRFRSDDAMVKMIYANFLAKNKRGAEAIKLLDEAVELGVENSNLYYNMGLIYLDLKEYEKALNYAHQAYRLGFPLPGLRDRLRKAQKWRDPMTSPSQE